ncbi:MAG: T9SS type A sorting domain-containing protein [Bacteroidales bacterium]|nr:T9SS type A sorting domain-containing protein [Bacteroidales bacterium]
MKKPLLTLILLALMGSSFAQWTTLTIPNISTDITVLTAVIDTVYAGFAGDGIHKTTNLGTDWSDISFNLANKNINTIKVAGYPVIFVSTGNGAFFTLDQLSYTPVLNSGLTNTNISHYSVGGDLDENDFTIGTNGGGFFYGPEIEGPWTAANNGLSGDALFINDLAGYKDEISTYMLGTDGGVFYSSDEFASWTPGNTGLSGAQLHVTGVLLLNTISFITTEGGAFYSMDFGASWITLYADVKFNQLLLYFDPEGAFGIFLFGQENYYTPDLENWMNFQAPGEVISAAATREQLFVATSETKSGGIMYSQPISWIITDIAENITQQKNVNFIRNYPNPFNEECSISYHITKKQPVEISLFDLYGRKIKTLENGVQEVGEHTLNINGNDLAAGIYTVVLISGDQKETTKIVKR